jgi:hypothetical protein
MPHGPQRLRRERGECAVGAGEGVVSQNPFLCCENKQCCSAAKFLDTRNKMSYCKTAILSD